MRLVSLRQMVSLFFFFFSVCSFTIILFSSSISSGGISEHSFFCPLFFCIDGVPPMAGIATVTIAVIDVNEAPLFTYTNAPVFSVTEGASNGDRVHSNVKQRTIEINSQSIVQSIDVDVPVVQGLATGTLAVKLVGDTTTVVVISANDQVFDTSAAIFIGTNSSDKVEIKQVNLVSAVFVSVKTVGNDSVIVATDVDEYANLFYDIKSIKTGDAGVFVINRYTGALSVAIGGPRLDFETTVEYELLVRVVDNGGMSAEQNIIILVEDENGKGENWTNNIILSAKSVFVRL